MTDPTIAAADAKAAVAVRMYRNVLGDCFLLTHSLGEGEDRQVYRALIDCGVLQCIGDRPLTKKAFEQLPEIVDDLRAATGGVLDLVIATHEHFDHLSGFIKCHKQFKDFTIRRVWVAWTENRQDAEANDIRARGRKALSTLKAVVGEAAFRQRPALVAGEAAREEDRDASDRLQRIEALLQFYDEVIEPIGHHDGFGLTGKTPPAYDPATSPPRSCDNALTWLRWKAGEANVRYLEPGQIIGFGLNDSLKAHVLGPPRGKRLLQLDPSAGERREVYLTSQDEVSTLQSVVRSQAMNRPGAPASPAGAADQPFSPRHRRSPEAQARLATAQLYYDPDPASEERRIDGEWLSTAELLALKIDSDVNNTSLVLAIQVPGPARHILLFPADAQVGNWLSWHDQTYPKMTGVLTTPRETATDLLSRVALYKVGHHGSHNATAAELGLELMTSPDLVALIPVVEAIAKEQTSSNNADGWAMPYDKLYARLRQKTGERILRGDGDPTVEAANFGKPGGLFRLSYADAGEDPIWAELTMDVPPG